MIEVPDWLVSTLASDATDGQGVVPNFIRPLQEDARAAGPARVLLVSQDDNLSVRALLDAPPAPGAFLVIAGASTSRTATIGDLLAREMQNAGIIALVTDGLVRDSREIRRLGFSVWCRGCTPSASRKNGPAIVGGSVSLGGVTVTDGDLVIADDDGVVIWPQARFDELLAKAAARLQQDNARLAALRQSGKRP